MARGGAAANMDAAQPPHERILLAARDLFCRNGIAATGIDRVLAEAGASIERFLNSGVDETVSFIDDLTDREIDILRMIGQGLTVAEIADKLGRSAKTVEAHRANLREKLGLKRAAELARFATQWVERGN